MSKVGKIGVFSLAKFQAVLIAPIGLIAGISYSFGGFIYETFTGTLNSGTALAFLALIGMPIVFASFAFMTGLVEAVLYNLLVRRFGEIEIDFG